MRLDGTDHAPVVPCQIVEEPFPTECLVSQTEQWRRIRGTERMLANHPWASLGDRRIFLEGWDMAERLDRKKDA
jgi:hypothetical protein